MDKSVDTVERHPRVNRRTPVTLLLAEITRLRTINTQWKDRARRYRKSRDYWRAEAYAWKWGCLGKATSHGTPHYIKRAAEQRAAIGEEVMRREAQERLHDSDEEQAV